MHNKKDPEKGLLSRKDHGFFVMGTNFSVTGERTWF